MDNTTELTFMPALIAKERQLLNTLPVLESMLETVQELRTKVNFERTQLITLIEMAKRKNGEEEPTLVIQPTQPQKFNDVNNEAPKDPLTLLDKLYNGVFCISEEEEDDEDEDIYITGDNFGSDYAQW